jgi:hypothetical protein
MAKWFSIVFLFAAYSAEAISLLIPMDEAQKNHLKAYGIAYYILKEGSEVDWLLNYRGGSFLVPWSAVFQNEFTVRGISFEVITDSEVTAILKEISSPSVNMNVVKLERAPKVAVYSPKE